MALVTLDDLNGDHYLGSQEGEELVTLGENVYVFPHGFPIPANPLERPNITPDQARDFVRINASAVRIAKNTLTVAEAAVIALHRLYAVKEGLVSPAFDPQAYNVKYKEVGILTEEETANALIAAPAADILQGTLTAQVKKNIGQTFYDRVSLVAFVFRARGHHYTPDYQTLYDRVWKKCRYTANLLHITFEHLATHALHAIFPMILDSFWEMAVREQKCNGALAKRFDVAPAGAAGPTVLRQGLLDLQMIAPGIRKRLEDAFLYLEGVERTLKEHRFNGSVNARYYGAQRVMFEEKRLAAIAATIRAALEQLADTAPLLASPALKRIADNAPITGAVLGRAIGQIANRPEVVNVLMIE